MTEVWRRLDSFPLYLVSSYGRVASKNGIRKVHPKNSGYLEVILRRDNKSYHRTIHTLVLEAFVGKRPDGCEGSHLDANKLNNNIENLIWESPKENSARRNMAVGERHGLSKLTTEQVLEVHKLVGLGMSRAKVARKLGVSTSTTARIVQGRTWQNAVKLDVKLQNQNTGTFGGL